MVRERGKSKILGLGLDAKDEQVRITRGENFHLVGGCRETHESMQEKCIKFNEKLQERGKELDQLEQEELSDLAQQCQMNVLSNRRRPS